MSRVCVITGSRADYGLLYWPMKEIQADSTLQLQVIATGMHLSPEFGSTYRMIETDGFAIEAQVQMLERGDSPLAMAQSLGAGVAGCAEVLSRLQPDWVVLLGDRFEIFAAAQAAYLLSLPIAHLCGGDTTEGALDEGLRHSITKMAQLHFVTNADAARRVRQLGENPQFIFNVGSPGLDYVKRVRLLSRDELQRELGVGLGKRNLLVTYHPETLASSPPADQISELLSALDRLSPDEFTLLFTSPNADPGGRAVAAALQRYAEQRRNAYLFDSLGTQRYLSLMQHVDAVVGNSSSGLYEAPSFGKPVVDIGDRQRGRPAASCVVHCALSSKAISRAIDDALNLDTTGTINPYGDGESSAKIVTILKRFHESRKLLRKTFYNWP